MRCRARTIVQLRAARRASRPQLKRDPLGGATTVSTMREILRTSSISLAESLRLSLEAEDIPAIVSNENLGGLPPSAISVIVAENADYERSVAILNDLQQTTQHPTGPGRRILRLFVIIVVGVFCILCATLY